MDKKLNNHIYMLLILNYIKLFIKIDGLFYLENKDLLPK